MEEKNKPSCHGNSGGSGMKHMVMMLVCCLVPLGLVVLLSAIGYSEFSAYFMLLCPLMHIVMMKMMNKKDETKEEKAM